ncbi:DUF5680 domain-containing protein [Bacillus alkalicellulosilyticus]|uniref:DUF5680 domain-containing protein n=1 Tax=Alkalihalobacterium alkalicellulosilyticum TaxID=1912214 RepID=UPI0009975154|nr:DUF5680 domain-containing protein [Bacillus alkalicellulosilyticus]
MKFQEKLHVLRKEKGLSQEQLAEKIGVSRQAVAKWETGHSYPTVEKLIELSSLFNISIDSMVKEDEACSKNDRESTEYIFTEEVIDFLCRAKKTTYAGEGAEATSSRPSSHDLHYAEEDFLYIDTYLGGEKFAGEEALWVGSTPMWSMNYMGRILGESFSGDFLKEALFLVPKQFPYRGPLVYENGEYKYHCVVHGEFKWFNGYEEIFYKNEKVYECVFHGGCIK